MEGLVLRQWHAKYHPDAGPLRIRSAAELEEALDGDLLAGHRCRSLHYGVENSFLVTTGLRRKTLNTYSCLPASAREDTYSAGLRRIPLYPLYSHPSSSRGALKTPHNTIFPAPRLGVFTAQDAHISPYLPISPAPRLACSQRRPAPLPAARVRAAEPERMEAA